MRPFDYSRLPLVGERLKANARRLDRAAASGLRPPERLTVSDWAAKHRRFPDDAPIAGPWRHDVAPYLVEIMDALSPHDPCEEVVVIKCAQSGGTAAVENWIGFISDLAPGPMLFVQATIKVAVEWAAEKLWPMVEASPRLNGHKGGTIRPLGVDGGSNKHRLQFSKGGGYVHLSGANSAASLRNKTVRYAVEDDLDQFPDDLEGQGSPEAMIDARLRVYRKQGLSKRAKISTPTVKGGSKIGAAYRASDRRRYYLKCPHCGSRFAPTFADLHWPEGKGGRAHMRPPCCFAQDGAIMEHWQKAEASLVDGWLSIDIDGEAVPSHMSEAEFQALRARMPASPKRGFAIGGLITAFQTWGSLAEDFLAAQGDLNKLKAWTNLGLGEEFEIKGQTPDHEKLKELREQDWNAQQVPFGGLVCTMGVDVQGDGLYWERLLWGPNDESWQFGAGFIPGATDIPGAGAWPFLDQLVRQPIAYPGGRTFPVDMVCVDAGYHTDAAKAFCASHSNRLAIFGRPGWHLPVLGRGETLRWKRQGRDAGKASKRAEDKAFLVGTFGVKLQLYGFLRETIAAAEREMREGVPVSIRGRCHFNRDTPDEFFEQLTAETVVVTKGPHGAPRREWVKLPGRENHWLDCRVYNHVAASRLMLDTIPAENWENLKAERYAAKDPTQGDLVALMTAPAAPAANEHQTPPPAAVLDAPPAYLSNDGWSI